MAEIAVNTTIPDSQDRPYGYGSAQVSSVVSPANTAVDYVYVMAPNAGRVSEIAVQASVTSDATKTYTFVVTNESDASAEIVASTVFDDAPVLTAGTKAALSLTAANVQVNKGDLIRVAHTGGTGSGDVVVQFTFELA